MRKRKLSKREQAINTFYKWLIDNNVFIEYRENVRVNKYKTLKTIFNEEIKQWISSAFSWMRTAEGMDYWCTLAIKWDDYCRENNIEK